ncbi:MAG: hypothetical protein ABI882_16045 [Acidobacteriota bacterium]
MSWNLLLTDNVDQIDSESEGLVEKCSQHFGREFAVYRPLPFVDHTGFTETVREEIEFVVEAQHSSEGAYLVAHEFISQWRLGDISSQRVVHLSGGWRKFLGVALFANRKAPAKCFLDVISHLADERITMLLEQLSRQKNEVVVFCEYDSQLIFDMAPTRFSLLMEGASGVERIDRFPTTGKVALHSNYEHP